MLRPGLYRVLKGGYLSAGHKWIRILSASNENGVGEYCIKTTSGIQNKAELTDNYYLPIGVRDYIKDLAEVCPYETTKNS